MSDDNQDKNNKDNGSSYENAIMVTDLDNQKNGQVHNDRDRSSSMNRNPFNLASDMARHQYNSFQSNLNDLFEHSKGWVADSIDTMPNPLTKILNATNLPTFGIGKRHNDDDHYSHQKRNDDEDDIFGIKQFISVLSDFADDFHNDDSNTFETTRGDVISVLDSSYPVPTSRQFYNCQQVYKGYSAWDCNGIWRCLFLKSSSSADSLKDNMGDEAKNQQHYFSEQLQREIADGGLKSVFFRTYNEFLNHNNDKILEHKRVEAEERNRFNKLIWAQPNGNSSNSNDSSLATFSSTSLTNNSLNGKYITEDQAKSQGLTPVHSFYETKVIGENGTFMETKTIRKIYSDGSQSVVETATEKR
ncbi:hypothetical protein NADFUDRAFT_81494 [Nadsonia fulvescens var. elongata DSM 6958]|uniref:Mitochondrial peculiar membrane protein 1 n=1 Tax=Nadsonia fulvescens var. elongata DSM 6958 TaxID=857566 RepID=A0A1E3PTH5_9ASCO|nr:hypothetical protein NADFUDRAFT_81494 [Nadsonia fulvescens var. elongata DSM 6958]